MHSVNNVVGAMGIVSETSEIALEKIKVMLVGFEKKKRNLEKRRSKLEEYKKKADLNEDQQIAVNKYPEVIANLELLEELSTQANQQLRDAEKSIKKVKKQEKIDKKRNESQLSEFVLRNYCILDRVGSTERVRKRLVVEGITSEREMDALMTTYTEMHVSEKGEWKKCSEYLQGLYEPVIITTEEKRIARDQLLLNINKIADVQWLWIDEVDECASNSLHTEELSEASIEEDVTPPEAVPVVEEIVTEQEPVHVANQKPLADNPRLNFVFLHDSMVQHDSPKVSSENGFTRFNNETEARPSSQSSGSAANQIWLTSETGTGQENVEDVFSSATQSEFMHHENVKNAWNKAIRTPVNDRFRGRPNVQSLPYNSKDGQASDANYWKSGRGAFNSNARFSRPTRARGRGRGAGRPDNRMVSDALSAQ